MSGSLIVPPDGIRVRELARLMGLPESTVLRRAKQLPGEPLPIVEGDGYLIGFDDPRTHELFHRGYSPRRTQRRLSQPHASAARAGKSR